MRGLHDLISSLAGASALQQAQPQHAVVSAVDPVSHAVKVILQPSGVETGWLPDPGLAAGDLRIASPTQEGTHVLVAPVGGDAENPVIVGRIFDVTTTPPISPVTGKPAQAGEWLAMAGQGTPSIKDNTVGASTDGAGWIHLMRTGVFLGAGGVQLGVTQGGVTIKAGGATYTFSPETLALSGAAINTDQDVTAGDVSVKGHVHVDAGGSGLSGMPKQ